MYVAIPTTNLKQVEVHAYFQNSCRMRVKHRYRAGHILIMSHLGWGRVDLLGLTLNIQFSLIQNNSPAAWLLDYHDVTQIISASKRYLWGFESNVRRTLVNSPSRKTRPRQPKRQSPTLAPWVNLLGVLDPTLDYFLSLYRICKRFITPSINIIT